MTIQQAVTEFLGTSLKPDSALGAPMPIAATELCKCCCISVAIRDGRCFECYEHHEAETKRLKELLARCLPYIGDAMYKYGYNMTPNPRLDEARALHAAIEAELGAEDET